MFEKTVGLARRLPSDHLASYLVNSGLHQVQKAAFGPAGRLCQEAFALARRHNDAQVLDQSENCLRKVKAKKGL